MKVKSFCATCFDRRRSWFGERIIEINNCERRFRREDSTARNDSYRCAITGAPCDFGSATRPSTLAPPWSASGSKNDDRAETNQDAHATIDLSSHSSWETVENWSGLEAEAGPARSE